MNKKVAILTQPLKGNYGGIIQNYALQQALLTLGYEPETISREYFKDASDFRKFLARVKNNLIGLVKGNKKKIFSSKEADLIFAENFRFIKTYINKSKSIYNTAEMQTYFSQHNFDAIIVGSDQTWRPKYSPNIYNYFLDFVSNDAKPVKLTYATSFGTDQWEFSEEQTIRCKQLVQTFKAISVREESAVKLCKEYLDCDAQWVLDPTMLLTKSHYLELINQEITNKPSVFNYVLDRDPEKQAVLKEIANFLGTELFTTQPKKAIENGPVYDFENIEDYKYPSLESWLKSFAEASFVVTDSFHGTVFSIIFNKPFLSIVNEERGASRFYSLLKKFGLEHRLLVDYKKLNLDLLKEAIDYDKINNVLQEEREKSLAFLRSNLFES
ncbi:polysaccharide pyruvyl transferase family protein [Sphingobacterium humi]|uniref:Polysaccharide pyruvyl transferase family protein n=1 Tax=Sphingobacterium humi TaxID=1796905 RepID=A0A6N8KV48_9SPHI|nr:polysaccharide pyruvyl transferase family protein [Sphingobacterium humi]MVZ60987.1 polysaccharide pyruvyl transferase family protein [Sphingobacterium humi]